MKKIISVILGVSITVFIFSATPTQYTLTAEKSNFSKNFTYVGWAGSDNIGRFYLQETQPLANLLIYPLYAYQDYQSGTITEQQFFESIKNTQGAFQFLNNENEFIYKRLARFKQNNGYQINMNIQMAFSGYISLSCANEIQKSYIDAKGIYSATTPDEVVQDILAFQNDVDASQIFLENPNMSGASLSVSQTVTPLTLGKLCKYSPITLENAFMNGGN